MIYAITYAPDVELTLVDELRSYFQKEAKAAELFRNHPSIRISQVHPFAYLIDEAVNQTKVPVNLFPSVTIIAENDSKAAQTMATLEEANYSAEDIQAIVENRERYIISDETVAALQAMAANNPTIFARGSSRVRNMAISIEIWSENIDQKNRIYDLCQAFILGPKRYEVNDLGIKLHEYSMQGQRSGLYNYDFGKLLYGGQIRVQADAGLAQFFVSTDQSEIKSVAVSTGGVW